MNWYLDVLKKYTVFEGRSRRQEYWMFLLINLAIAFGIGIIEGIIGSPGVIGLLYSFGVLLPGLAVSARRLHDTDRSAWWLLISFIPILGIIALLIFMAMDSTPGSNQYGPNPKA